MFYSISFIIKEANTILGPVVQSIVSLTSLLRGQLIKSFVTLLPDALILFVEKMEKFLHCKSFLHCFRQKLLAYLRY